VLKIFEVWAATLLDTLKRSKTQLPDSIIAQTVIPRNTREVTDRAIALYYNQVQHTY